MSRRRRVPAGVTVASTSVAHKPRQDRVTRASMPTQQSPPSGRTRPPRTPRPKVRQEAAMSRREYLMSGQLMRLQERLSAREREMIEVVSVLGLASGSQLRRVCFAGEKHGRADSQLARRSFLQADPSGPANPARASGRWCQGRLAGVHLPPRSSWAEAHELLERPRAGPRAAATRARRAVPRTPPRGQRPLRAHPRGGGSR